MNKKDKNLYFFVQWTCTFLLVSSLTLITCQFAQGSSLSIPGKDGYPFFDLQGNYNIVYINPYGGMSLASLPNGNNLNKIILQEISNTHNVHFIRPKKDPSGKTWLVWEEREAGKSNIIVAQLKNNRIVHPTNITAEQRGYNFSPCIDFTYRNELWVTWVNYFQGQYIICVKNVTTGHIWKVNSSLTSSALSPQIIIDGAGRVWIFWVGQLRNRDEILFTYFDGERWSMPFSLNKNFNVPHITPSVSLDPYGLPHIAWSAYDGSDYELYYSHWNGIAWSQEKKITNNQNISDTFPSLSLVLDTIPIVAWSRFTNEKYEVCVSYKIGEDWSPDIKISGNESITGSPKIICSGEKIGVSWQEQTGVRTTLIHFYELQELIYWKKRRIEHPYVPPSDLPTTLSLNSKKYIGFGDSITYGYINQQPVPNRGYIPRLEDLIDSNITNSNVLNHGVPGEKTSAGASRVNSVINGEQAKSIFLMEGTNDVKSNSISTDTAAHNLDVMVTRCLQLGMKVFLASIIPSNAQDSALTAKIIDLNNKIRSIASSSNAHFVDQYEAFESSGASLFSDSTHPNDQGYQIIARAFYSALADTLPLIETNKDSLTFEGTLGGSNPASKTFKIRNSGGGGLDYEISTNREWINVSPDNGHSNGEWDEIQVSVDISNLSGGNHEGNVTITSDDASNSPQRVTINLTVIGATIDLNKDSLSFEGLEGGSNPSPQKFQIRNSEEGTLNYQISTNRGWLSTSPDNGVSTGEWDEIEVSVNISNLSRGSHEGHITITAEDASNSPQRITVELTILGPNIELSKTSLSFQAVQGGSNPTPQKFKIKNSGAGTLNYQISNNRGWISVSPESGESSGEWDEIEVSVDISNLSKGDYQGTVTISSNDASNSPQTVSIELTVLSPDIELNKTSLSFQTVQGGSNPTPQKFKIKNSGAGTLNYQISKDREWISVSPESGESSGEWDEIEVSVDISSLSAGNYQGTLTITAENISGSVSLSIELIILSPTIELSITSLSFEATLGEPDPSPQKFKIRNSGAGTLNYQISKDREWINVSPESGESTDEWDEIEVSVNISNLSRGSDQGTITISAENTSNSPQTLTANITIKLPPIYPPKNFRGEKNQNRSLSQLEYINILNWESNSQNKNVTKYKIYMIEEGNRILIDDVNAQTLNYWHRNINKDRTYVYEITTGDDYERESEAVSIEVK